VDPHRSGFTNSNAYARSGNDTQEIKMTTHQRQGLRRSRRNRIVAGVCGGLAEFFGISAFWFRLAMVIAFIPGGVPGLLIYILLWLVIPSE
jgi:phage shock protein C